MTRLTISKFGKISKLLSSLKDAIGKTIYSIEEEEVGYDHHTVIRFTDQTALISGESLSSITFDQGYEREDEALVYFGLLSEEQFETKWLEEAKIVQQRKEWQEKREYERLKAKYGPPDTQQCASQGPLPK